MVILLLHVREGGLKPRIFKIHLLKSHSSLSFKYNIFKQFIIKRLKKKLCEMSTTQNSCMLRNEFSS